MEDKETRNLWSTLCLYLTTLPYTLKTLKRQIPWYAEVFFFFFLWPQEDKSKILINNTLNTAIHECVLKYFSIDGENTKTNRFYKQVNENFKKSTLLYCKDEKPKTRVRILFKDYIYKIEILSALILSVFCVMVHLCSKLWFTYVHVSFNQYHVVCICFTFTFSILIFCS